MAKNTMKSTTQQLLNNRKLTSETEDNTMDKSITDNDLNDLWNWANNDGAGSRYPNQTYEQGIRDVVDWLQGSGTRPDLLD